MAYFSFEKLDVWQQSCRMAVAIYKETESWNDFGLKNQMTRAAVSIASNIAQGLKEGRTLNLLDFLIFQKGLPQN